MRERLDQHLVRTGLARSRTQAQRLIRSGDVRVAGRAEHRPSYVVPPGQDVQVARSEESRWVGRGALKLLHALQLWGADSYGREYPHRAPEHPHEARGHPHEARGHPHEVRGYPHEVRGYPHEARGHPLQVAGRRCLDVGASTGGFTQVLLAHGAREVTALDVGHGQLVPELAADPRVTDLPGTNIRDARAAELGRFDLIVGDVSFISLTLVLPVLPGLLEPGGQAVLLVKPQFEVGPQRVGRGGVVTDPQARRDALRDVTAVAAAEGLPVRGIARSPVTGSHGNTEYLLWLGSQPTGMMSAVETSARIDDLTREDD